MGLDESELYCFEIPGSGARSPIVDMVWYSWMVLVFCDCHSSVRVVHQQGRVHTSIVIDLQTGPRDSTRDFTGVEPIQNLRIFSLNPSTL
jgi:hypothetical protein